MLQFCSSNIIVIIYFATKNMNLNMNFQNSASKPQNPFHNPPVQKNPAFLMGRPSQVEESKVAPKAFFKQRTSPG
jgi:hypothetical protein